MLKLPNKKKMRIAAAMLTLSIAGAASACGQQFSLEQANEACGARFNSIFPNRAQAVSYAEVLNHRQQRERNQSKITNGMTEDDLVQLLGPPDHAGVTWPDSAEILCIWTYNAVPNLAANGSLKHRNLEITMNLKHQVVAVQFHEPWLFPEPWFRRFCPSGTDVICSD